MSEEGYERHSLKSRRLKFNKNTLLKLYKQESLYADIAERHRLLQDLVDRISEWEKSAEDQFESK
jgi:hypothetical protein